jgi:hypothetical protein
MVGVQVRLMANDGGAREKGRFVFNIPDGLDVTKFEISVSVSFWQPV